MSLKKFLGLSAALIFILAGTIYIVLDFDYSNNEDDQSNDFPIFKLQKVKDIKKVRSELKKFNMIKRLRDESGNDRGILIPKENFTKPERLSHYQSYVTPNHPEVINYVNSENIKNIKDAYKKAVSWTWVSDSTLHGKQELWLKPKSFIKDTPKKSLYPTNPANGMASDCESQAYTLVSIAENIGFSKDNIRVVVGLVNFSGVSSGHAWVQIYQNNDWFELEATSGPYYDDDTKKLVSSNGVSFNYFKTNPYPVEEYWVYFNDIYYYNPDKDLKSTNLPSFW